MYLHIIAHSDQRIVLSFQLGQLHFKDYVFLASDIYISKLVEA